jgi:hypothetical protein
MKKRTILVATLLMMVIAAQAQQIQKIIDKYSSDDRFTYVSVGSGLMDLGMSFLGDAKTKVDGLDFNTKDALSKLKGIRVLTLESEKDEKIMKTVVDDLTKAIREDSKAESLVEVKDKGEITNIFFTSEGLLIVTKDAKELTVVCILGEISKKWIQELVSKNK